MPHDLTEFTPADEKFLREIDQAFQQELDYRKFLEEQNGILSLSAQRWCEEAKEQSERADKAERGEKRNRQAFERASLVAVIGWLAFWAAVLVRTAK